MEKAGALAIKIGTANKRYNSAELSRPDALTSTTKLWAKVRQLTGRCKNAASHSAPVSAESLNEHYATISTDSSYITPAVKCTVSNRTDSAHISERRVFKALDTLCPTATGLDNIPSWFLRIGAPVFAAPLADILNMSQSGFVSCSNAVEDGVNTASSQSYSSPHTLRLQTHIYYLCHLQDLRTHGRQRLRIPIFA